MSEKLQNSEQHRSARRRLIKGSFAAPAALTLTSGSAFARTSSLCVANDAQQGATPGFLATNSTYQRVRAFSYVPDGVSQTTSYWIRGSDIRAIAAAAGVQLAPLGWIADSQSLCVEGGSGAPLSGVTTYVAGTIYATPPAQTDVDRYYAVLFDTSGNITGISGVWGNGGAVHQTCWSSFVTGI